MVKLANEENLKKGAPFRFRTGGATGGDSQKRRDRVWRSQEEEKDHERNGKDAP